VRKERGDEGPLADNPLAVWLRQQEQQLAGPPRGSWAADDPGSAARDSTEPIGPVNGAPAGSLPKTWDVGPDEDDRPRRPRPRLVLLAVIPWVLAVLLAVGLLSGADPRATTAPVGPASPAAPSSPQPDPTPSVAAEAAGAEAAVGQVAALAVRSALSGPAADAAPRARFVEDAVATGVQRVGDLYFVTVSALVLEGGPGGWDSARVRRYAVPVRVDLGGPAATGPPWPVADPPPAPPGSPSPEIDPGVVEGVRAALTRAGYTDVRGLSVTRDPLYPGLLVAHVDATGPGEAGAGAWDVWLRDGPAAAVLGDAAAAAVTDLPEEPPTPPVDAEDPR